MLLLCWNVFLGIVGLYAAFRFAGIAMDWIRAGLDSLRPPKSDKYRR